MQLYHEAVLLNLLEVLLYHQHAAEALEDEMIDLVDVCARKMTLLNARDPSVLPRWFANAKERFDWESTAPTAAQLAQHRAMLGFRACVSAVTVARYLGEHIKHLSVSTMARVMDTHGAPARAGAGAGAVRAEAARSPAHWLFAPIPPHPLAILPRSPKTL